MIAATAPQRIEIGKAVMSANHGLAIDQEGFTADGWRPQRSPKAIEPNLVAALREQTHPRAFPADHEAEAIVFDLMNPDRPRRRPGSPPTGGTVRQIRKAGRRYAHATT